eukprot:9499557-Pyramimonas_sp.AAC.2
MAPLSCGGCAAMRGMFDRRPPTAALRQASALLCSPPLPTERELAIVARSGRVLIGLRCLDRQARRLERRLGDPADEPMRHWGQDLPNRLDLPKRRRVPPPPRSPRFCQSRPCVLPRKVACFPLGSHWETIAMASALAAPSPSGTAHVCCAARAKSHALHSVHCFLQPKHLRAGANDDSDHNADDDDDDDDSDGGGGDGGSGGGDSNDGDEDGGGDGGDGDDGGDDGDGGGGGDYDGDGVDHDDDDDDDGDRSELDAGRCLSAS